MRIIAGIHKGQKLYCPTQVLRPTSEKVRGAFFNICQMTIEDAAILDLFSGIGAIGLEALSRRARFATFVENNRTSIEFIKKNILKLKEEGRTRVMPLDVFKALKHLAESKHQFDIIFADPPYGKEGQFLSNQVLLFVDAQVELLTEGGELFLEDDIDAEEEDLALKNLKLKSRRHFGRTLLRQFVRQFVR